MNTNVATLCPKPIDDLLNEKFFIPSYQRGFRWTPRQVKDLLDDISAFQDESDGKAKESFYCLQPIVVMKRSDGYWELIDGQQRLTTLFLILSSLSKQLTMFEKSKFSLCYETRPDSGKFLDQLDIERKYDNIDYYHLIAAHETIKKWFDGMDGNRKVAILQCLTNPDNIGRNVKVIWYELPDGENPVDVFIRLNVGKIPLTNAELIRALFLRLRNFETSEVTLKQLQIAQEWDGIEKILQSDDFWFFLHKDDTTYATRIEYIFWLITKEQPIPGIMDDDPYYTFIAYSQMFEEANADMEWLKVKHYFMACEEWFKDRILFHLVGYLVTEGESLVDIRHASKNCGKLEFQQALKRKVFKNIFGGDMSVFSSVDGLKSMMHETLGELNYEGQSSKIRSVLLLFNIATLLQNSKSNLRFPFDSYKKESWDIEHIRSVKSDMPARVDAQKLWLENVIEYWTGSRDRDFKQIEGEEHRQSCLEMIAVLDAETFNSKKFEILYEKVLQYFDESGSSDVDHGLANLALLDAGTNRSYKNAVFPIKRKRILGLDKDGTFVPLCTTNVFLKYYSRKIDDMMFWSESDRLDYFNVIVDTLVDFFTRVHRCLN